MKLILEGWRKFIDEASAAPPVNLRQAYAAGQKKLKELLDKYDNYVWVYYDTETTGLKHAAPTFQVTQWGAIAIDYGPGFSNWKETKDSLGNTIGLELSDNAVVGTFNPMQTLDPEVKKTIPIQEEDKRELRLLLGLATDEEGNLKLNDRGYPALLPIPNPIYLGRDKKVVDEIPDGASAEDYLELTGKNWVRKIDIADEIIGKYFEQKSPEQEAKRPSAITKLKDRREIGERTGDWRRYRSYAATLYKNGIDFNIASALEMTRYHGREGYKTRKENLTGYAQYLQDVEAKTGKDAFIVAHNMPYDRKALEAELKMARTDGDAAYEDTVKFLAKKFDKETGDLYDTVKLFKSALTPIIKELSKVRDYNMETPLEAQLLANLEKTRMSFAAKGKPSTEAAGKKFYTVSLGPITQGFKIPDEGWHDALADVIMTSKMLARVIAFIQTGQEKVPTPIQGELPLGIKQKERQYELPLE